jgi:hypothetical protein
MALYRGLADAVLLLHLAVVLFVVAGPLLAVWGHWRGWRVVNGLRFRLLHGALLGVVIVQAWLGQLCPLTVLESWLRVQGGEAGYGSRSFIGHWVGRLLFYEAPLAVFAAVYTAFGLLVLAVWWWVPLQRQPEPDAMRAR